MKEGLLSCLALVLLAGLLCQASAFDDVVGCDGFVHYSPKLMKLPGAKSSDFTAVKVHLYTIDGVLKETAECAPNGYYFIPVYDRGASRLKLVLDAPSGWVADATEMDIEVKDGACVSGDMNFQFTGFQVQGQVSINDASSCSAEDAFAGVILSLTDSAGTVVQTTSSANGGTYSFDNVFPRQYTITASHSRWTFASSEVEVKDFDWGLYSVSAAADIKVSGFDLSGLITEGDSHIPASDVVFKLFDKQSKLVDEVLSNEDGHFSFSNLACGEYVLEPSYESDGVGYDVAPTSVDVDMKGTSTVVTREFQVTGFSVSGSVSSLDGRPISDVTVYLLDSANKRVASASTGTDGTYRIQGVSEGVYSFKFEKPRFEFDPLTSIALNARNCGDVPSPTLTALALCGSVRIEQLPTGVSADARTAPRAVTLSDAADDSADPIASTKTNVNGEYCFSAPVGKKLVVLPSISPRERAGGLILSPANGRVITLSSTPVLDAHFSQARVSIGGSVKCLGSCDTSLTIELTSTSSEEYRVVTALELASKRDPNGMFMFREVLPGQYRVSILQQQHVCWDQSSQIIDVSTEDFADVSFVQTGYRVSASASNEIDVSFSSESDSITVSLTKGDNEFCVPSAGVYSVSVDSCYTFKEEVSKFDTSAPSPLSFSVDKYKVPGTIKVDQSILKKGDTPRLRVVVDGKEEETVECVKKAAGVYEYVVLASVGKTTRVSPLPLSTALFYPSSIDFSVSAGKCQPPLASFEGREGKFIEGSILPDIFGVTVTVTSDDGVVVTATSAADGSYTIGPLYDDREYEVTAFKRGYHFTVVDDEDPLPSTFRSVRLGSAVLSVRHDGSPVVGVLNILSGAGAFTSKAATDDHGIVLFDELFPGSYFVRPVLKEYKFSPASLSFDVEEGVETKVEFSATRVGFSCIGSITSITGSAEKAVTVQAKMRDGDHIEEVSSDSSGYYRIRGLRPGAQYDIYVLADNRISRSIPAIDTISVSESDTTGKDFIVFKITNSYALRVDVDVAQREYLANLEVVVYNSEDEEPVAVSSLWPIPFVELTGLPENHYYVSIRSSLDSRFYSLTSSPVVEIDLDEHSSNSLINLSAFVSYSNVSDDIAQGSIIPLLLVLAGAAYWFYGAQIKASINRMIAGKPVKKISDDVAYLAHLNNKKKRR